MTRQVWQKQNGRRGKTKEVTLAPTMPFYLFVSPLYIQPHYSFQRRPVTKPKKKLQRAVPCKKSKRQFTTQLSHLPLLASLSLFLSLTHTLTTEQQAMRKWHLLAILELLQAFSFLFPCSGNHTDIGLSLSTKIWPPHTNIE
jgi:hypothetical protein